MLNTNDMAKVVNQLANDAKKREMHDILSTMNPAARANLVNGTRCLVEISEAIQKQELASSYAEGMIA